MAEGESCSYNYYSHAKSAKVNIFANSAPAWDETLTLDDAADILEELLYTQNHSFVLGLKLKLPIHEVEAIHMKYSDPRDRLLRVIIAFLGKAEPRPTWRVIVEALRSPAVNLPALASRVEAAHIPEPTAAHLTTPISGESVIDT